MKYSVTASDTSHRFFTLTFWSYQRILSEENSSFLLLVLSTVVTKASDRQKCLGKKICGLCQM